MEQLLHCLPKDLVDYVYTFRPDHRIITNQICEEINIANKHNLLPFTKDTYTCDNCEKDYDETQHEPFLRTNTLGNFFVFCSGYCQWDLLSDLYKHERKAPTDHSYRGKLKIAIITEDNSEDDEDYYDYCDESYDSEDSYRVLETSFEVEYPDTLVF